MTTAGKSFSMEFQRHEILTMTGSNMNVRFFVIMQHLKLLMEQKQVRGSTDGHRYTYSPRYVAKHSQVRTLFACTNYEHAENADLENITVLPSIGHRRNTTSFELKEDCNNKHKHIISRHRC